MIEHALTVNGTDWREWVCRGEYATGLVPVWSKKLTTKDGKDHVRLLRYRDTLTVTLNPLTDEDAATVCADLYALPAEVTFYSKQRGRDVTAKMTLDGVPLSEVRWRFRGLTWNEPLTIAFVGL